MYYIALATKNMTKKMGCNTTDVALGLAFSFACYKSLDYKGWEGLTVDELRLNYAKTWYSAQILNLIEKNED